MSAALARTVVDDQAEQTLLVSEGVLDVGTDAAAGRIAATRASACLWAGGLETTASGHGAPAARCLAAIAGTIQAQLCLQLQGDDAVGVGGHQICRPRTRR